VKDTAYSLCLYGVAVALVALGFYWRALVLNSRRLRVASEAVTVLGAGVAVLGIILLVLASLSQTP
jgi:hypothetical protein